MYIKTIIYHDENSNGGLYTIIIDGILVCTTGAIDIKDLASLNPVFKILHP